jgi:hypothetical protein
LCVHEKLLPVIEVSEILDDMFIVDLLALFEGSLPVVNLQVRGDLVKSVVKL